MELNIFQYQDTPVRTVTVEGEPWFVAADVARLLGYSSTAAMTRTLEADEKGVHSLHTPGGDQDFTIVSESGLYSAIFRSRVPGAQHFKRWITREVLPSIRKHGGYLTDSKVEEVLADPDTIIRLATDLKTERERRAALEAQAVADKPKVLFADAVSTSKSTILIGELAKILRANGVQVGQNRLFQRLRDAGFLIRRRGSDWNMPTQRSMEMGLFDIKETAITHSDGHVSISKTTKVTGKGQQYFIDMFIGKDAA